MTKFRALLISAFLGITLVIGFQNCGGANKETSQSSTPPTGNTVSDFVVEAEYTDPTSRTRKVTSAVSNTAPVSLNFYFDSANGWFEQQPGGQCTPTRVNADNLVFRLKPRVPVSNCKFTFTGFNDSAATYTDCTADQITAFFTNGTPIVLNTNRFVVSTANPAACVETSTARMPSNQGTFDIYVNCSGATCQFRRTVNFTRVSPAIP